MNRLLRWASAAMLVVLGPCVLAQKPDAEQAGNALAARLNRLLQTAPANGFVGIEVVQVLSGKTLFRRNEDRLFLPASNMKLLTSALALERLHGDYRYSTRVLRQPSGDVVLAGAGDPALSDRPFPYDKTTDKIPVTSKKIVDRLAEQMVAHGVTRIDGDVVGDDTLYPWDPYPPSWTMDDAANDYGAPVSALTLNENIVTLSIRPGAEAGDAARFSLTPALEFLSLDNRVVTGGKTTKIDLQRLAGSGQWRVSGNIAPGSGLYTEALPVDDPALFAAAMLYEALLRQGVAIRGRPVARHRLRPDAYVAPEGDQIAVHRSPELTEILQVMDKVSHNLFAELILREVARVAGGEASTAVGVKEMGAYLAGMGAAASDLHLSDWHVDDGSGLSRNAMVTPRLLSRVLVRMAMSPQRDVWRSFLPVGGDDGTLDQRLCCLSQGKGIRAKTGSLDRVSALSGYADSKTYGALAFSILVNDFSVRTVDARHWVDRVASSLLQ